MKRSATGVGRGVPRLRFVPAVLLIFLRQDESLDSPFLARIGESRFDDAFKSYYRSGKYLFIRRNASSTERKYWRELTAGL